MAPAQRPRPKRVGLVARPDRAGPSHDDNVRGHRHTMLDDSDIAATRHARAFVCGALSALVGHSEIYVSGGAEHQGPDGSGPVALIVARAASQLPLRRPGWSNARARPNATRCILSRLQTAGAPAPIVQ